MKALNILLVEDSPLDVELIEAYLVDGGIEFSLLCVETREDFIAALEKNCYDIVLADYMLPCFNGIEALEIVQAMCPGMPFIFVSATLGEEVAIETLKSGATDYVLKGRLTRLVPSIKRALREVQERLDRKQAQAQRQESEDRFRIMADTAPVMIWMSDADRLCDYFNKVWLEFTGRNLAEAIGNGWMESLHPDDLQHCLDTSAAAFDARVEYRMEYRLRRSDGEYRWVLGTGVPRYRPDRTFAGYIGSCIDISDRKFAEQERAEALEREETVRAQAEATAKVLLEANSRIAHILESITDGFFSVDLEWNYTYVNRKAEELLGKSQAESIGKSMWEVFPWHSDSECYKMAHKALADKVTLEYEEFDRFVNKWFNVRLYPSESGLSAYFQDITDRKRLEAELRDRVKELGRVNRIKDEFLATLSHELRTPLNAMLGWTQLLRYRKFDEDTTVRALETIDRNTRALGTLIEDLLDVSQIITGKLSLNLRSVDAISTVEGAIDTLAPAATAKNIEIVTDFDPSVGRIYGDSGRLQQVAWNLLSNAIKFTPDGGQVSVAIRKVEGAIACKLEEGEKLSPAVVEIEVSDTGEGLDPEFLLHVFDRFSQADSSTTRSHDGLGLGLAIVRHLVELHGGTVQAESAGKGQGARFLVRLPVQQPKGDSAFSIARGENFPVRQKRAIVPVNESPFDSDLSGVRVLVVDDDEDSLNFARAVLENCGAQVETVVSVTEALESIFRVHPDVLISDIGMPVQDGYDLIRQVRAIDGGAEIQAVALTAYARVEERVRALREGFQIHLPKPIDPAELAAVVASLVSRSTK